MKCHSGIEIPEVTAALRKDENAESSKLVSANSRNDIGIQWLTDLCSSIVKEGCIPEHWKSSMVIQIYKGKSDPRRMVHTEG